MPELTAAEKKLIQAINKKQYNEVKALLNQSDVSVNCVDETGMTPLQHACYHGDLTLVDLLLSLGADVNSNMHKEGYTALMFAALNGSTAVVSHLLDAGARTSRTNSVGRTAAQMAAFVGQHQVVSIINNFVEKELVDYFTLPDGPNRVIRLPPELSNAVHKFVLLNNIAPVNVCLFLCDQLSLIKNYDTVARVMRSMCEKYWKGWGGAIGQSVNEVLSFKIHLLAGVLHQLGTWLYDSKKKAKPNEEQPPETLKDREIVNRVMKYVKFLLKGCEPEGIPEMQERLLRQLMKEYPWLESELFHQTLRHVANQKIGNHPTALHLMMSHINGQQFFRDDDQCSTCNQPKAEKRCSRCRSVHYCGVECQNMHWFTHKKFCPKLAEERDKADERERQLANKKDESDNEDGEVNVDGDGDKDAVDRSDVNTKVGGDGDKNDEQEKTEKSDDIKEEFEKSCTIESVDDCKVTEDSQNPDQPQVDDGE